MVKEILEKILADFYEKGFAICDHFVPEPGVDMLLTEIEKRQHSLQKAGIGNKANYLVNEDIRGDFIKWIDSHEEPFASVYFNKLKPLIELFNQRFFLGISANEHHIAYYPKGTHYEKHVDTFKDTDARVISSVLYLNRDWKPADAGELVLYSENGTAVRIEPLAGRLVLFESTLQHEVLTCNAPRYSITGWFKRSTLF